MIEAELIIDDNKSLLTIMFNGSVLNHLKAKCDDYLNFYQASHKINFLTLFKADTGYRITRVPNRRKTYQISIRHPLYGFKEFNLVPCTYYLKGNGFIRIVINI